MEKITPEKVLEIFGAGRIVVKDKPLFCEYCDPVLKAHYECVYQSNAPVKELVRLIHKRHARIVERKWPDGRKDWGCHRCGRHVADFTEAGQWKNLKYYFRHR
jgi:hypothetical protein